MSYHGYDPGDRNNWYQSPQLGLFPASPPGYGVGYYCLPSYHPHGTRFPSQPSYSPPPPPSATIINGYVFPHQFPHLSANHTQLSTATPSPHNYPCSRNQSYSSRGLLTTTPHSPLTPVHPHQSEISLHYAPTQPYCIPTNQFVPPPSTHEQPRPISDLKQVETDLQLRPIPMEPDRVRDWKVPIVDSDYAPFTPETTVKLKGAEKPPSPPRGSGELQVHKEHTDAKLCELQKYLKSSMDTFITEFKEELRLLRGSSKSPASRVDTPLKLGSPPSSTPKLIPATTESSSSLSPAAHYTPTQAPGGSSLPPSIDFYDDSDSETKESIAPNLNTNEEYACGYEDLKKRGRVDKHSGSDSSSEDDDVVVVLAANSKKENLEFFEAKIKVKVLDSILNNKEVGLSKSIDNEIEDTRLVKAENCKAMEFCFKRHNELEEIYSEVHMDVDSDGARQILNSLIGLGNGHYFEFNSRYESHSPKSNETKTSKGSELALGGLWDDSGGLNTMVTGDLLMLPLPLHLKLIHGDNFNVTVLENFKCKSCDGDLVGIVEDSQSYYFKKDKRSSAKEQVWAIYDDNERLRNYGLVDAVFNPGISISFVTLKLMAFDSCTSGNMSMDKERVQASDDGTIGHQVENWLSLYLKPTSSLISPLEPYILMEVGGASTIFMVVGETSTNYDQGVVPPNSTLYYEVELLSFVKDKESWDMNTLEKMEVAVSLLEQDIKTGPSDQSGLNFVSGIICKSKALMFERMLFHATSIWIALHDPEKSVAGKDILIGIVAIIDWFRCALSEFGTVATLNAWLNDNFLCLPLENKPEKVTLFLADKLEKMGHKRLFTKSVAVMFVSKDGKYVALGSKDVDTFVVVIKKMEHEFIELRNHILSQGVVNLLEEVSELAFAKFGPSVILLTGLQGIGKTTVFTTLKIAFLLCQVALTRMGKIQDERFLFSGGFSFDNYACFDIVMAKQLPNAACHSILFRLILAALRQESSEALRRWQYALLLSYFQYCQHMLDLDIPSTVKSAIVQLGDVTNGLFALLAVKEVYHGTAVMFDVAHVINFDFSKSIDDYVHKIGPTGMVVELIKDSKQEVPNWLIHYAQQSLYYGGDQSQSYICLLKHRMEFPCMPQNEIAIFSIWIIKALPGFKEGAILLLLELITIWMTYTVGDRFLGIVANIDTSCSCNRIFEAALEHLVLGSRAMVANGQEVEVNSVDSKIGDTYLPLSGYDEAVFAYEKVLNVFKTTKGENHPSVGSVFICLADLYNRTGKVTESISYCENAIRGHSVNYLKVVASVVIGFTVLVTWHLIKGVKEDSKAEDKLQHVRSWF